MEIYLYFIINNYTVQQKKLFFIYKNEVYIFDGDFKNKNKNLIYHTFFFCKVEKTQKILIFYKLN